MPKYLETANDLRKEIEHFVDAYVLTPCPDICAATIALGHIVNLAVRCNPRQSQGTVRKNIVAKAMQKYCEVQMTRETDEKTKREYNKIHITSRP